jgi:hypothetical protein
MSDVGRLTKEEWDDLEPRLAKADRDTHERFVSGAEAKSLLGDTDKTPGFLLLQRLKELGDETAVKLFRAAEMYHHEITRADIGLAYLRGKEVGRAEVAGEKSR